MQVVAKCVCSGTQASIPSLLLTFITITCCFVNAVSANKSEQHAAHKISVDNFECSTGFTTKGVTYPSGDIAVLYGNPLEMFCILNPETTNQTAESLVFYNNSQLVDKKHLEVINETTVRLFIEKPEPSSSWFYCRMLENGTSKEANICLNAVAIGFKPKEVKNFSCLSYNWENLTCTWDIDYNPVKTSYALRYFLPGRNYERLLKENPDNAGNNNIDRKSCYWDKWTKVLYRLPFQIYYFRMTVSNALGKITQNITFNHYAHVIPAKAVDLSYVNKTCDAVTIQWNVSYPLLKFPPGLIQRVEYRSQWDKDDPWQVVNTSHLSKKSEHYMLKIEGLKYAHTKYDIRVFMRSALAIGNNSWSEPATLTIKTMSAVPAAPPNLTAGCFEIVDSYNNEFYNTRDIYVYWQQLPEYLHNGDNFSYRVKVLEPETGKERELVANETSLSFARFRDFPKEATHLKVYSVNSEGYSVNGSNIFIPSARNYVAEPMAFTKILLEKDGNFRLTWKKPELQADEITGYTVFWCENINDRPYPCKGYLKWKHVSNDTFNDTITVPGDSTYQFAVATRTAKLSSNMVWASCTIIRNQVSKIKNLWVTDVGSTFIVLNWKLECSDRVGQITGYLIQYCEAKEAGSPSCKDNNTSTLLVPDMEPSDRARGNITDLKPYKTYLLSVAILMTNNGKGVFSKALHYPTLEGAPATPPKNVTISQVTNTSIVVRWLPPSKDERNGVLQEYRININGTEIKVPVNGTDELEQIKPGVWVLNNLLSFTTYRISMSVCCARDQCSNYSYPTYVDTLMGIPGVIDNIQREPRNGSKVLITWSPPFYRGGLINYYELMIKTSKATNQPINSSIISGLNKTEKYLEEKCDEDEVSSTMYYYYVRAVNIGEDDNTTYYGNWSKAADHSCHTKGLPKSVVFIIILSFAIVVTVLLGYLGKGAWNWVNSKFFASLGVKLPPGLDPPKREGVKESAEFCPYKHGFLVPEKIITDGYKIDSPPDQELLLMKKANSECAGDGDGDSSGCSSAHESVSSSITSGTHISDSGTEADQRAESPDGVFLGMSPDLHRHSSQSSQALQQSPPTASAYCRVGEARMGEREPTSGYVSHVSHLPMRPQPAKATPIPPSMPTSMGYVMAGTPNLHDDLAL